jgi:hypothetical protein
VTSNPPTFAGDQQQQLGGAKKKQQDRPDILGDQLVQIVNPRGVAGCDAGSRLAISAATRFASAEASARVTPARSLA